MATAARPAPETLGAHPGAILVPAGGALLGMATRAWVEDEDALALRQPVPALGEVRRPTQGHNTGVAFGVWQDAGGLLLLLTSAIITVPGAWRVTSLRRDRPPIPRWPFALVFGGALASFLDRLPDGRVTDLLDVGIGAARWPTFNLADTSIVLGVGALAVLSFWGGRERKDTM